MATLVTAGWTLVGAVPLVGTEPLVRAETIVLANGTQLTGHVLSSEPGPNEPYVIQLDGGGKITLTAAQVQQVLPDNPKQTEYRQRLASLADTPAAHWEMAEWCRGQQLKDLREAHLQHVLRLDPEHADARHALGLCPAGRAMGAARRLDGQPGLCLLPQPLALAPGRGHDPAGRRARQGREEVAA